ncbi:hypothetical protein BC941DRAFT_345106 [Chlamydoabsidia padenii]|nr:hypothetical protein BC941DRAFT_345106 [Chlamydoabsidia padenii]
MDFNKKYGTLTLDLIDVYSLLSDMVHDPTTFGIVNTNRAFWDDCQGDCNDLGMDEYLWWDRTHLTGAVHHTIGNSVLNAGSYAPSTSVNKVKVERLLMAPVSVIRSPIYRAPPNTGVIQKLVGDPSFTTHQNQQQPLDVKDQITRFWSPLLPIITLLVALGILIWWMKRRHFNKNHHQLLKHQDCA